MAQIAGLYGERELLPREVLIVTILIVQFVAFAGAVLHGRLAARFGAKRTVLGSLVGWTVVVTGAYFVAAGRQLVPAGDHLLRAGRRATGVRPGGAGDPGGR